MLSLSLSLYVPFYCWGWGWERIFFRECMFGSVWLSGYFTRAGFFRLFFAIFVWTMFHSYTYNWDIFYRIHIISCEFVSELCDLILRLMKRLIHVKVIMQVGNDTFPGDIAMISSKVKNIFYIEWKPVKNGIHPYESIIA